MFRTGSLTEFYPQVRASSSSLLLLLALLRLSLDLANGQSYNLVLDSSSCPPAVIPSDPKDLVYSVPLNQLTSRPTIAYVQNKTGKIVTSLNKSIEVYVTSMDKSQKKPSDLDKWRDSGGQLCQWSNPDVERPTRLNRAFYHTTCGSSLRTTTLIARILKGEIYMDWLKHVHPTGEVPADDRFIRIEIPDLKLSIDTNLFKITEPAARLSITKQPPMSITANTKFDITAEIQDRKGAALTVGLDSVAYVELTVSYDHKEFHQKSGKDMILKSSKVRLGGPFVTIYQATGDLVIRQRAVAGKVSFTDVRILDIISRLKLNLTMFMTKDPFLRIPDCEKCYSDVKYKTISDGLVKFHIPPPSMLKDIPSLKFTKEFDILPQVFAKLKYTSNYIGKGKMKITRNFAIAGPLTIETQDTNGNRIYSGSDSNLAIVVKTVPQDVCLSNDHSAVSREGIAIFTGSICEIRDSVFLIFYSKKIPTMKLKSHELVVVGDVHIAHFDHFQFTGAGRVISPHINSFVRFAANDVNSGIISGVLRPYNMTLIVDTIETKNDITTTVHQYRLLREKAVKHPSTTIRAVILPKDRAISTALVTEFLYQQITHISLDEQGELFSDYPYFNRVCWNSKQIYESFFEFCCKRHWMRLIVLKTTNVYISRSLYRYARTAQIELHHVFIEVGQVQWETKDPDINIYLSQTVQSVKNKKIKVIVCFANHTQLPAILLIAKKEGLSPEKGYQWVFISNHAWEFPFNNSFCDVSSECTTAFGGTILFTETYNTSLMHTNDWERVLIYYYTVDKSIYLGLTPVYPNSYKAAQMALGYDAIWLYAEALAKIVFRKLTVTKQRINKEMRKVTIHGLSGTLKLDKKGDREGFLADIRIINATQPKQPLEIVASLYKFIKYTGLTYIEYVYEDDKNTLFTNETVLPTRVPVSEIYNIRSFESKSGRVSKHDLQLVKYANEEWPSEDIVRKERTLPPFTCRHPCGNRIISEANVNEYDIGRCISMNQCKCNPGYFGTRDHCSGKLCLCSHGYCHVPMKCICNEGYTGYECNIPICPGGCKSGVCVQPNNCQCFRYFWVGGRCHIHLGVILITFTIILILLIYLAYTFLILFRRCIERAVALSNIEWLVDWQDVIQQENYNPPRSISFGNTTGLTLNVCYIWKDRKWFVKNIDSDTVDEDDENVRLEMVELISLNHQNLIRYGGACLVSPNVCFLVEPTQKGSLEDILLNKSINLNWNFRFSFMKDICRGMNFLHSKTEIGSHGRLKSSNCLLDNRWCIRITDFGAPTIRYGPYLLEKSETEQTDGLLTTEDTLLWTAPELLETASCLDDVRMGTKEGDVYSFAIVISEIVTRDLPFAYERGFLSICALIDLIVNRDDPMIENKLEILKSLGTTDIKIVRPYIHPEYLAGGKADQSKFLRMLENMWDNDPLVRITFQKLTFVLDDIFPTKKELMDNLMHLLESYSRNLEHIVIDRTDVLEAEKTKVENIVRQMLPRKVIEELKNGKRVEPENFECVTVYYSDIVGFTTIAMNSQPMEVVDLLNDLYSLFDSILAEYDVYKVETIGDAYVVSSGVPTLNDNLHAGEIATASLNMMSAIMSKEIPHLRNVTLKMRLGINTGSVVAGVVGLKMPRYTLFGETMQIAATMESSSKPMHIQMTEHTVKVLKELGGYTMTYRCNMRVCGKIIDTYWLTGKTGFHKLLPAVVLLD